MLCDNVDEFITASEEQIINAIRLILKTTGYIVEPAGAIGLAAVIANRELWHDEQIAVVFSGGNLNEDLRYILDK